MCRDQYSKYWFIFKKSFVFASLFWKLMLSVRKLFLLGLSARSTIFECLSQQSSQILSVLIQIPFMMNIYFEHLVRLFSTTLHFCAVSFSNKFEDGVMWTLLHFHFINSSESSTLYPVSWTRKFLEFMFIPTSWKR